MYSSENQHTVRMGRHEAIKDWERRADELLEETDTVERGIDNYERVLGHAVMAGEIDAEEAYRALSNYAEWSKTPRPGEIGGVAISLTSDI